MQKNTKKKPLSFLTFRIGNHRFAISTKRIVEVLTTTTIYTIPVSHKDIIGVINFRGEIIPLINTHQLLDYKSIDLEKRFRIIISNIEYETEYVKASFIVDEVMGVLKIPNKHILNDEPKETENNEKYYRKTFAVNSVVFKILSIDELLSPKHFIEEIF